MELKDNWKRPEVAEYLDKGPLHEKREGLIAICGIVADILRKYPKFQMIDVACGPGSVLKRMLHRGVKIRPKQYLGTDYSDAALERARKHFPDYKFKNVDAVEGPIPRSNLIVCADLLQHLANPLDVVENLFQATKRFCIIGTWVKFNGEDWNKHHTCNLQGKIPCIHRIFDIEKFETRLEEWDWKLERSIRMGSEGVVVLKKG